MGEYRTSYVTSAINVVDAPISRKSPEQWRAIVEYKGLAFVHDNNFASIAYDLKASRATFDPNLAGGNGGFRCPVGTRYGGQITDRYGRGCGFGVARRLVNAIGDGARRAERGLDKRRERRVQRRNARVGRQLGIRGYTAPGRGGRGMATRLDDFADRRDRRQRRGGSNGPGMATRLEEFADRRDRRQGRGGRGIATRLEEFADRRDRRQGRGGRGFATRLEDFADRDDERRGIKPRKRRDVAPGLENGGQGVLRPDAQNRRSRRTDAVAETATNRPRPKKPSTPVAVVKPPQRRQRGQQIDVNNLDANGKKRLNDRLDRERDALNAKWRTRLGGEDPTPEKIRAYVKAREQRSSPGYVNTIKAMERDFAILNSDDRIDRVNDLAPSVRKRLAENTPQAAVPARPRQPRPRPNRPRPAPEADVNAPSVNADVSPADRAFINKEIERQGLKVSKREEDREVQAIIDNLDADELELKIRDLRNSARANRQMAANEQRPLRERLAAKEVADRKEARVRKMEEALDAKRGIVPEAPSAPGAAGNPPETPKRQAQARKPFAKLAQRITRKNEAKLGRLDKNGYGKPQRVEVGNKGIADQANANKYLKDGGDLADIPDDFLGKAIQFNAKSVNGGRFVMEADGGGINGMERYLDTKTGKKIGLKFMKDNPRRPGGGAYGVNEDLNEIVGAHIAERFGFANGVMRFAGPARHSGENAVTPIAVELVQNYVGDVVDGRAFGGEKFEVADLVRGQLFDAVILNTDRHGGNYFVKVVNGKKHFVPIDNSLGFNGRPGTRYSGRADAAGFAEWFNSDNGGKRIGNGGMHPMLKARLRAEPALAAEVRDEILAMQRDLKKAHRQQKGKQAVDEILAAVPNRTPVTTGGKSHYDAIKRLEWLMNANPDQVLDLLRG